MRIFHVSCLSSVVCLTSFVLSAAELVVAPGGLTPQGALEKIRAAKVAGDTSAWTVRVKPGVYALDRTLLFTPADSGTPQAPVTWIGEKGAASLAGPWAEADATNPPVEFRQTNSFFKVTVELAP